MQPQCPECGKDFIRRSHRQGTWEQILSLFYVYPFRCQLCMHRFRAFQWGARYTRHPVDQRQYERIPVRLATEFSGDTVKGQGKIVDLSIAGCSMETTERLAPGQMLRLTFRPGEQMPQIEVNAAVVRSVRPSGIGLEFLRLESAQQAVLREFLFLKLGEQRE